jgi:rhamnogalacturonan endolyase
VAKKSSLSLVAVSLVVTAVPMSAQRVMENLGRGVVAVRSSDRNVYVGWRMLATDPPDIAFNVYRSTDSAEPVRLNPTLVITTTDFVDTSAPLTLANTYFVRPVLNGIEQASSARFALPANTPVRQYLQIPLQIPPSGTATCGANTSSHTYSANDGSLGDLDGDGQYEIILKWDPSDAKDNSQSGCTGPTILDAYKLDGTRLWRINLGPNIRSGAHYTQFMVYDLDGDGKAELVVKTADGTIDGKGTVLGDPTRLWANPSGYILAGPEYLTVFDGATGAARASAEYVPVRGTVDAWGDNYGNRVDRFLAAVAYLDGVHPSVVMCRGYYTRTVLAAWDWRDGRLTQRWVFDSQDPAHPEYRAYEGQGNHSLSVADADGDGLDEIIYGAAVVDHDGTGRFTTGWGHGDAMHVSRFDPNNPDPLVFGVHENSGITAATCSAADPKYGSTLYNARTGALVFGTDLCVKRDFGRGMTSAVDPAHPGYNFWGGNLLNNKYWLYDLFGQTAGAVPASTNFAVWWDADLQRELEDGVSVLKYDLASGATTTLLTCPECASNNGTKATPVLVADLFGDWREEVVWRTADNHFLRIYTTTIPAANRMYTLLQDPQYRVALAWQNVAYNQPPWPSFYLGPGMSAPPTPNIIHPVMLAADLIAKDGPPSRRIWTLGIKNAGTASAQDVVIERISFDHLPGARMNCHPKIIGPPQFPMAVGTLAPGAAVQVDIDLDFTRCSRNGRVRFVAPVSAMNGGATALILRASEPR